MTTEDLFDEILDKIVESDEILIECVEICEEWEECFGEESAKLFKIIEEFENNVSKTLFRYGG